MMSRKKKRNYWLPKHEELIKQILIETNPIQRERLLIELRPALRQLTEIILRKYYSGYYHQGNERQFIYEAINFLWMKLDRFNPDIGTGYNFCGMIIKRFYYNKFIFKQEGEINLNNAIRNNNNTNLINDDINHDYVQYDDDYEVETDKQLSINKIRKHLENLINRWERKNAARGYAQKVRLLKIMIEVLDEGIESYEGYILEIYRRYGIKSEVNFKHLFKSMGFSNEKFSSILRSHPHNESRLKDVEDQYASDWMIDDWTDIDNRTKMNVIRKKILENT